MLSCRHVLASIADQGAGPSYSVLALAQQLEASGVEIGIDTVAGWRDHGYENIGAPNIEITTHAPSRLPILAAACSAPTMATALAGHARRCDVIHTHGLWLMPNVYPSWAARLPDARARVVLSPRGMLGAAALDFSATKKWLFWSLLQRRAMSMIGLFHATSVAEYEEIRAFGLVAPVAVIPNGIAPPPISAETVRADSDGSPRTALYLGRLHPKKGIDLLVRAWASIEVQRPEWQLQIIGPAENGHDKELRALASSLCTSRIEINGPRYGDARLAAYRSAELFVLPTRHENFGMTVAEALAAGVPVISTKGAPWAGLEIERCGWWIDHGVAALEAALIEATARPVSELREMGGRGREWMVRDFGWARVAAEMADAYSWLIGEGPKPATVRID